MNKMWSGFLYDKILEQEKLPQAILKFEKSL